MKFKIFTAVTWIIIILVIQSLTGCAAIQQANAISDAQEASENKRVIDGLCASEGHRIGRPGYEVCFSSYAQVMPHKPTFAERLQAMGQQQQAQQDQQHREAVFAANPAFANCMYNGSCAPQNTHTTCQNRFGKLECDSY